MDNKQAAIDWAIVVTEYDLSVYPNQTATPSSTQRLARMTLTGPADDGHSSTPAGLVFYIDFFLDCSGGLGPPGLNPGDSNTNPSVQVDMYYSQLENLIDSLNDAIMNGGPTFYAGYTDGPHVEFNTSLKE